MKRTDGRNRAKTEPEFPADDVDGAVAFALREATRAGEWVTVTALANALAARGKADQVEDDPPEDDSEEEATSAQTQAPVMSHSAKVRQGQERARARGTHMGRPSNPKLTPDVLERAREMRDNGDNVREIARTLRVPKTTLHRTLSLVPSLPEIVAPLPPQPSPEPLPPPSPPPAVVATPRPAIAYRPEKLGDLDSCSTKPLNDEGMAEMVRRAQAGDKGAATRLVASCEGLIQKFMNPYRMRSPHILEDMAAAARIKVFLAIQKFDPERGMKFSSFAVFAIRKACREVWSEQQHVVTIPINVMQKVNTKSESIYQIGSDGEEFEIPLAAPEAPDTDVLARANLTAAIEDELNPREQRIIKGLFLDNAVATDLADSEGLSKARIGQIKLAALEKLRDALKPSSVRKLLPLTPELLEQAKELLIAGATLAETAEQLRICRSTLHRALPKGFATTSEKKRAWMRKAATNRWAKATPEQKDQQGRVMREGLRAR